MNTGNPGACKNYYFWADLVKTFLGIEDLRLSRPVEAGAVE
jgi:hypothetical protein